MSRARKLRSRSADVLLVGASLAAALLLGELVVRRAAPQPRPLAAALHGLHATDTELGYVMVPGFRRVVRTHDFVCELRTNSLGLRDGEIGPRRSKTCRILGLGDSFALGMQAGAAENCFLERLESLLGSALWRPEPHESIPTQDVDVINAGVIGYGTSQEVGLLERLGDDVRPDAVLLAFFLGNDFTDNSGRTRMTVVDGYHMLEASAEGYRHHFRPLQRRVREYLHAHSELYLLVKRFLLHPSLALFSRRDSPGVQHAAGLNEHPFDLGFANSMRPALKPDVAEALEATRLALQRLRLWCDAHGARALVVAIPAEAQVNPTARAEWLRRFALENEGLDFGLPNRRLAGLAEEVGLPVHDLTDALADRVASGAQLYLPQDGHWNARGHAVVAELLVEPVLQHLLGPDAPRSRDAATGVTAGR